MMQKFWISKTLCGNILTLILVTLTTPGFTRQEGLNFISEIRGNVRIKKKSWNNYHQVYGGELLSSSDKLRLAKGATAKVICNNLRVWNLNSQGDFEVSNGCPSSTKQVLIRSNTKTGPTRAGNDPRIPYLIIPRNTAILTRQPTLRWHPVVGATSYQVQVLGPDVDWSIKVSQPEVVYSGNQPLKPGFYYRVIITANNGASTENKDNFGFTVLSDTDTQRIKTEIAQLQQQPLNNESKILALAHLYRSNNLNADAIELLERLVKKSISSTAVYQLLGSIYQQIGLTELARERYLTALKLAKAENNLEGQAIIQASLGEVDIALVQLNQAYQWFKEAQSSYRVLGDEAKVGEMQQQLDDLKERISLWLKEELGKQ